MELIRIEYCGYIVTKKIQDRIICMLIDADTEVYTSGSMDDICCICMKKHRSKNVIELKCCGKEFGKECLMKHIRMSMTTTQDRIFDAYKNVACPLCRKEVILQKFWYPKPLYSGWKLKHYNGDVAEIIQDFEMFEFDHNGKRRPGH